MSSCTNAPYNGVCIHLDKPCGPFDLLDHAGESVRHLALRTSEQIGERRASLRRENIGATRGLLVERVERLRAVIEQAREIHGGVLEARRGIGCVDRAYETMRTEALALIHELEDRLAE